MLTQEIIDLIDAPQIKKEKIYDLKLLKLPKYKEHIEGNIHYLEETVTVSQFMRETNFDSIGHYDPTTHVVLCYVESNYLEDLANKHINLPRFITDYNDGMPEVVIEDFSVNNGWFTTIELSIDNHKGSKTFKADTGATFSVINLEDLCKMLSINPSFFKNMLNTKKYSLVSVITANGVIQYLAITVILHAFNENTPIILYVDLKNRLRQPLLGFDIITSLDMICKPGQPPTVWSFDRSVNTEYIKKNNTADNASVDLYTLYLETQNSDKSTHTQTPKENIPIAKEQIARNLLEYGKSIGTIDLEEITQDLLSKSTPNILESEGVNKYKPGYQAWTILQILNKSPLRYHESEDLGTFIYNTDMYSIKTDEDGVMYLDLNPDFKGTPKLPEGCTSTRYMFYGCELPEGSSLGDKFDTSNITNMSNMLSNCKLPEGISLGNEFDTSKVKAMQDIL